MLTVILVQACSALADEARARVLPLSLDDRKVSGLTWGDTENIVVQSRPESPSKLEYFVILKGKYDRSNWKLLIGSGKKVLIPKGEFYIEVVLNQVETALVVTAVDSKDQIQEETRIISFPQFEFLQRRK